MSDELNKFIDGLPKADLYTSYMKYPRTTVVVPLVDVEMLVKKLEKDFEKRFDDMTRLLIEGGNY